MTEAAELLGRLVAVAGDAARVVAPLEPVEELTTICGTARRAFGAAAVSVAQVDAEQTGVRYLAADGEGAVEIVGLHLPAGRGLANMVAATGQALAIERTHDDPRFARDVAEATGYVPTSMLLVPVHDARGEVAGAVSVLDRARREGDDLDLAASFAALASTHLARLGATQQVVPILLAALGRAAGDDLDLADALHAAAAATDAEETTPGAEGGDDLPATLALLAELQRRGPDERRVVTRAVSELLSLSSARRRR